GEALQAYCQSLPPDTVTLVYVPDLDWRAQKAAWFSALENAGIAVEAKVVPRKALPQWIAGRLKDQQQDADAATLDFIADRVEGNLLAAHQEVQKLALLFPQGPITFDQVSASVLDVARYDVFNLGEIMIEGDPLRVARVLDGLQGEGTAAPLVLWSLTEEIRAIGKILTGVNTGKPASMMLREARIWGPSHQSAMQNNLRRFTLGQVTEALRHAAVIDRIVKGLVRGDAWNELLQLALRFARNSPGAVKVTPARRVMPAAFAAHPALF
ncbi:MAG: DNA polymerase III subunit delta, partial [Burkholderiales bacterium]